MGGPVGSVIDPVRKRDMEYEAAGLPPVEETSAQVHRAWMATKQTQGVASRPSEWGEEQMVDYAQLTERAKDLDRGTVRSVYEAILAAQERTKQATIEARHARQDATL